MRRHLLVARFGFGDTTPVPAAADEVVTRINLVSGQRTLDFGIGRAVADLARLGLRPDEIALDLLIVAAMVHAADTRISRADESQDSWTREIRLAVPVSDVAVWRAARDVLQTMLNFLTGDRWIVDFRSRPDGMAHLLRRHAGARPVPRFDDIGLFSGGLDSLIGAIDALEEGKTPLLVSHAGDGATSDAQKSLFNSLQRHYHARRPARLRLWMTFERGLVEGSGSEDTTRGRSFLFIAAGAFAGSALGGLFVLRVPENGLIALNVPLDPLRLGSLSTRTTHPYYMARWNDLLAALGITGRVENRYSLQTKGEMVTGCANQDILRELASVSLSCASPTKGRWQGLGTQHCGYCLPCLIRRGSLAAGFGANGDMTTYTVDDLTDHALDTLGSEGKQARSFQFAIARLALEPGAERLLIHKPGPLTDEPENWEDLANVYRRGLLEVGAILTGVRTRPGF